MFAYLSPSRSMAACAVRRSLRIGQSVSSVYASSRGVASIRVARACLHIASSLAMSWRLCPAVLVPISESLIVTASLLGNNAARAPFVSRARRFAIPSTFSLVGSSPISSTYSILPTPAARRLGPPKTNTSLRKHPFVVGSSQILPATVTTKSLTAFASVY